MTKTSPGLLYYEDMTEEKRKLPLPPLQPEGEPAPAARRRSVKAVAKKVAGAPGKLMQRVNEELYKRNAELAVRNKTLALLRKLDEISLATVEMEEMAKKVTEAIATELGYSLVSLAVVDETSKKLQWLAVSSSVPWARAVLEGIGHKSIHVPISEELVSMRAIEEEKPQFSEDLQNVYPPIVAQQMTIAQKKQGSEPISYSMIYPLRFGKRVLGLMTISASRSLKDASQYEHESITGIIGLVSLAMYKADIYEDLQETSAQLTSANKQLKELDKTKSEFLSLASHQLYTPLTALRGYLSMLQEGDFGQVPDKQGPILDILNTSAERLISLIKTYLDISRIESGRLELNLASVDLVKMTDDLVQSLFPNAEAKSLKLAFHDPAGDTPHVIADEQRLRQVLLNFIDNAIKYTPKGHIEVKIEPQGTDIVFSVTDTGKGIAKEELGRLFNKFSRVGGASRFHTEGTGLGLYFAKQIVNEHHGDVEVSSPGVGKGSTFGVRLPIEGSPKSLKLGDKATVVIKAADATGQQPEEKASAKNPMEHGEDKITKPDPSKKPK